MPCTRHREYLCVIQHTGARWAPHRTGSRPERGRQEIWHEKGHLPLPSVFSQNSPSHRWASTLWWKHMRAPLYSKCENHSWMWWGSRLPHGVVPLCPSQGHPSPSSRAFKTNRHWTHSPLLTLLNAETLPRSSASQSGCKPCAPWPGETEESGLSPNSWIIRIWMGEGWWILSMSSWSRPSQNPCLQYLQGLFFRYQHRDCFPHWGAKQQVVVHRVTLHFDCFLSTQKHVPQKSNPSFWSTLTLIVFHLLDSTSFCEDVVIVCAATKTLSYTSWWKWVKDCALAWWQLTQSRLCRAALSGLPEGNGPWSMLTPKPHPGVACKR